MLHPYAPETLEAAAVVDKVVEKQKQAKMERRILPDAWHSDMSQGFYVGSLRAMV